MWTNFVALIKVRSLLLYFSVIFEILSLQEGLILVGGNTMSEVSINLNVLSAKQQSIVGIPKGTPQQLQELIEAVSEKKVCS